ncbi:MAG: exopolysaccharide biosynthesis polyprenyl glycosylphosphotransferase [Nonlabens sp.]
MNTRTLQSTSDDRIVYSNRRYSGFIKPLSYIVDLGLINYIATFYFGNEFEYLTYALFLGICWIVASTQLEFYKIKRNTVYTTVLKKLFKQSLFFFFIVFAFFGYYYDLNEGSIHKLQYCLVTMVAIAASKTSLFFLLKNYRSLLGGNFRKVVIVGNSEESMNLKAFFTKHKDLGYRTDKVVNPLHPNFSIQSLQSKVLRENIDEIFCSTDCLNGDQMLDLTDFADNNLRTLKFIPKQEDLLTKGLKYDYYGQTPILSLREIPLDDFFNQVIKRTFDIVFSLLVILGLLSWLVPIIAVIIKIESRGSIFFSQKRNGLDYEEFTCYKFRSMVPNKQAHLNQVSRNDVRITRIGRFLRKTSIDELPQFLNVLMGDMSVVGPRPHMVSHTNMYAEKIDKFMVRHFVKPGITGLAQVSGYRGEVETDDDIKGRVRNDIYYIENWSLLLDLKIVGRTISNVFLGEEKAY